MFLTLAKVIADLCVAATPNFERTFTRVSRTLFELEANRHQHQSGYGQHGQHAGPVAVAYCRAEAKGKRDATEEHKTTDAQHCQAQSNPADDDARLRQPLARHLVGPVANIILGRIAGNDPDDAAEDRKYEPPCKRPWTKK